MQTDTTSPFTADGIAAIRSVSSDLVLDAVEQAADAVMGGLIIDWHDDEVVPRRDGCDWRVLGHTLRDGEPTDVIATYGIDALGNVTRAHVALEPADLG